MADDKDLAGGAGDAIKTTKARGKRAAKGALGAVGGLVGGAAAAASDAAKAASETVSAAAGDAVDAAKGAAGAVSDTVGDAVSGAADMVKSAAGAVGEVAGDAVDAAKGAAGAVADTVGDLVSDAGDAAKGALGAVGGMASGAGAAAMGAGAAVMGGAGALAAGIGKAAGGGEGGTAPAFGGGGFGGRGRLDGDEEDVDRTGGLWPVLLAGGLIALTAGAWYVAGLYSKRGEEPAPAAVVAPAAPAVPAWLTAIGDTLKANFAWLGLGGTATQVIASGTAPDQTTKDGALTAIQEALTASEEGKMARLIDNITVTGSTDAPVGAALAGLPANPDVAACNKAFADTMAGRTINFETGSAVINDSSRSLLNALTGIASACATHTIEVGGHTDTQGLPENNQRLSQARADAVKAFWVTAGVAADGLAAMGYGETRLKETTPDQTPNEANRRIEFTVAERGAAPAAAPAAPAMAPEAK